MSNVYVIASSAIAAKDQLQEMRERTRDGSMTLPVDTVVVPVFKETDMRGRKVGPDDTVVVCGDWSSKGHMGEVKHLVDMFNSRRDGDRAPELRYRLGEAPEAVFWVPLDRDEYPVLTNPPPDTPVGQIYFNTGDGTVSVFNGQEYVAVGTTGANQTAIGIETQVPPAATTTTTSAQVAWREVLAPAEQRLVQDAQDAAKREHAIAADMRAQVKKAKAEVDAVRAENRELREWLSGVLPVEDPDLPGLFYCGVCGHQLGGTYEHLDGCPAAPA